MAKPSPIESLVLRRQLTSVTTNLSGSSPTGISETTDPTLQPHKRPPNLGAIVGGAVGGLAAVVFLVIVVVWLYFRRQKRRGDDGEKEEMRKGEKGKQRSVGQGAKGQERGVEGKGVVV